MVRALQFAVGVDGALTIENQMVILILKFENDYRIFKMTDRKKNIVTWQRESELLF